MDTYDFFNGYTPGFFPAEELDDEATTPHLPLDWNEEISLEDYLERLEANTNKFI